jgi:flagellar motility protein MotE (MotC chaperone)
MESLVKIYESMKPKDAARIFEALELPILLDVMERMREAKSAPILAAMDPMKAKEVTSSLAERRTIPAPPP